MAEYKHLLLINIRSKSNWLMYNPSTQFIIEAFGPPYMNLPATAVYNHVILHPAIRALDNKKAWAAFIWPHNKIWQIFPLGRAYTHLTWKGMLHF